MERLIELPDGAVSAEVAVETPPEAPPIQTIQTLDPRLTSSVAAPGMNVIQPREEMKIYLKQEDG
jgi:hypothetical protein